MPMALILWLLGPTLTIYIGLHIMDSVPLTFILFYGWLVIVPVFDTVIRERYSFRLALEFFGLKLSQGSLAAGFVTGILCLVTIFAGISWLQPYFFEVTYLRKLLQEWGFSGRYVYGMVLILFLVNPVLEEIYWRGFMAAKLKDYGSFGAVNLIIAASYGLYHILSIAPMFKWPLNVLGAAPVFLAGLLWGGLRYKYGSLAGPIISHMLADAGIMLIYFKYLS
ncbi:MAG: CPBP family intramembrane glutamic endopeptidase [bacterium]|jgi:membrane protease YdiL (CAAX protease family)